MLKALFLRKKIDERKKALEALKAKDADFESRSAELAKAIEEVTEETTKEERDALDEMIGQFEQDQADHEQ